MRFAITIQIGLTQKLSDQVDQFLDLLSPSTSELEDATKENVEATENLNETVQDNKS